MNKRILGTLGLITLLVFSFSSCYYDKKELVYPIDTTPCDTSSVTYVSKIQPILANKCYACHSGSAVNGGGVALDSYSNAVTHADHMLQNVESGAMPQGGPKLDACSITQIRIWVNNGTPN